MSMRALKFLRAGATGPFSAVAWPLPSDRRPGAWLRSAHATVLCRSGVHACRAGDLPLWMGEELWRIELAEPVQAHAWSLVAPAGRLTARVGEWGRGSAADFATACARRARDAVAALLEGEGDADAADALRGTLEA
jgi:hypothetical protein